MVCTSTVVLDTHGMLARVAQKAAHAGARACARARTTVRPRLSQVQRSVHTARVINPQVSRGVKSTVRSRAVGLGMLCAGMTALAIGKQAYAVSDGGCRPEKFMAEEKQETSEVKDSAHEIADDAHKKALVKLQKSIMAGDYGCDDKKKTEDYVAQAEELMKTLRGYRTMEVANVYECFDALIIEEPKKIHPIIVTKLILFDRLGGFLLQSLESRQDSFSYEDWHICYQLLRVLRDDKVAAQEYQDTVLRSSTDTKWCERCERLAAFIKGLSLREEFKMFYLAKIGKDHDSSRE